MTPAQQKKHQKEYRDEYKMAEQILKDEGGTLEWSYAPYECFRFKADKVFLIFYPHKTSAFNYHVRVRDSNSKDKERAAALMRKLDDESGHNCTFTRKNH